jgi:prolyl oligopeptidase
MRSPRGSPRCSIQWATGGDAPVWLRIQRNAGHGGVDQVKQKIEQNADTYAFLMWQLGMKRLPLARSSGAS